MSTAKQITQSASQFIGVKRSGVDLTTDELQDATDMLRDMLLEWQASGIKIPFNIPMDPLDEMDELDWTTSYMKLSLAMRLGLNYTVEPTANLFKQYKNAMRAVYIRITKIGPTQKTPLLPIGSGNEWFGSNDRRYYVNEDKEAIATGSDNTLIDDEGNTFVRNDPLDSSIIRGGQ